MAKRHSTPLKRKAAPCPCGERRVKVYQSFYDYRPKGEINLYQIRPVPWVQLKGYWLEQAGFTIHTPIQVRVMKGCLVLTILGEVGRGMFTASSNGMKELDSKHNK
jgi:hypothetical protein